tara:strand:+ start:290 stop:463 length:174 start_codon:yes stop_codon:yes gene_type:complete
MPLACLKDNWLFGFHSTVGEAFKKSIQNESVHCRGKATTCPEDDFSKVEQGYPGSSR